MYNNYLKFNGVSFEYEDSVNTLFDKVSFQISNGWTGLIGANGSGKTTLLKLACGLVNCTEGTIDVPGNIYYTDQRTDKEPPELNQLRHSRDKYAFQIINRLEIDSNWIDRWNTLSHGERKRLQIACALLNKPDILAVDEPTNHLDTIAKKMIVDSLSSFNGVGLIVSHDRDFMENLCDQFIFIDPPSLDLRKGKLSEVIARMKSENDYTRKQLDIKKQQLNKLEDEYKRRSSIVDKAKKKSSKRYIDKKDRDSKAKIDLGRLTGKDSVGGKLKTAMETRLKRISAEIDKIEVKPENRSGIKLSGSVSHRNYLLNIKPDCLDLSEDKKLIFGNLFITPTNKVALAGVNGSGKSTLIRFILKNINADPENIAYIPQEISIEETRKLIEEIRNLSREELGRLLIIISRLGSDAKRILDTEIPSPGETRKLLLGLGITRDPHIIIMDEPTNHLDMISIECLEEALQEVSCALLLVSHDERFLNKLTDVRWEIVKKDNSLNLIEK